MKNTKESGIFQIFSYFDEIENTYVAVCLEFNIILTGDNPGAVAHEVSFMAQTHIQTVQELNLPDNLLNRLAPKKYWDKFEEIKKQKDNSNNVTISSPYQIKTTSEYVS